MVPDLPEMYSLPTASALTPSGSVHHSGFVQLLDPMGVVAFVVAGQGPLEVPRFDRNRRGRLQLGALIGVVRIAAPVALGVPAEPAEPVVVEAAAVAELAAGFVEVVGSVALLQAVLDPVTDALE